MNINRKQRDYLRSAVVFDCEIHRGRYGHAKGFYWDGDKDFSVKVGPLCEKLIDLGLMARIKGHPFEAIRSTSLANRLKCPEPNCTYGTTFDDDVESGTCQVCEGTGMLLSINDRN